MEMAIGSLGTVLAWPGGALGAWRSAVCGILIRLSFSAHEGIEEP